MKALFKRFNRAQARAKDKVKDPMDSDSLSPPATSYQKEKPPQLPPLRDWPPPPPPLEQPERSTGTPTSITSHKPLPEHSSHPLPPLEPEVTLIPFTDYYPISISDSRGPLSDVAEEDSVATTAGNRTATPRADQDSAGRNSCKTGNGSITTTNGSIDVPTKVALHPPPLAPSDLNADRPLPEDASASNMSPVVRSQSSHPKDSTAASGSRPDVGSSENSTQTVKDTSSRSVTSPYLAKPAYGDGASIHQSLPPATPFSQKSIGSVLPPASSEGAGEDLVTHLGPRERARQGVLSESVASEERYVAELLKMKDAFIVPLLPPYTTSPVTSPHQLPDDLRRCLEVIEDSILAGHLKLSEGLRKRYDEQYPLVRSLADVFVANSQILRGYADYVLHLEGALEQANDMITTSNSTKRPKNMDVEEWLKVCAFLRKLENDAQDRGETGLAISLSKPFQRLLKYPLLFQNLLFHTDPSDFEYESALLMAAEVENIVRSIEDEKIQKEERDKTRDILARIEGLDKVKRLAAPKPSRVLVEERTVALAPREFSDSSKPSSAPTVGTTTAVRGKTSFRRLSDVLQNGGGRVGGKNDMWWVVFNDVVLRCQRTGTTSLPLGSAHASRANFVPELQGESKDATTGQRNSTGRPRNLYKFIRIENGNSVQPRKGVVSMEDVVRPRAQIHSARQPRIVSVPDDDEDEDSGNDFDDDNKSKASKGSSYWSADKITLQKPIAKRRPSPGGPGTRRYGPIAPSGYSRESSANAKFGHRLVSADSSAARPASRRTVTPSGRRPAAPSDEEHSIKVSVTRPVWDERTRTPTTSVRSTMQSRNTSQNSAATRTTTAPPNKVLSSPAPSEDSGVGFYRRIIANDPSLASLNKVLSSPDPSEESGVGLYRQIMANDLSLNND